MTIHFITASHNQRTLEDNLLKSPVYKKYPFSIMKGYNNISKAYNDATALNTADIIVYLHQDVYLPASFEQQLLHALETIPEFGVLGCAGVLLNGTKKNYGHILDRTKLWGDPVFLPHQVDTLDEMLLITHGDFIFDENLSQDFYGSDICLQARKQDKKCYAINAFCHHNSTRKLGERTESFYASERYFKEKWKEYLPIATTCALIQ